MKKLFFIATGIVLFLAIAVFTYVSLAPPPRPLVAWIDSAWNLNEDGGRGIGRQMEHRSRPDWDEDDRRRGPRWGQYHRPGPPPGRGPDGPPGRGEGLRMQQGRFGWAPIEELMASEERMEQLRDNFPRLAGMIEEAAQARERMVDLLNEYQNTDDPEEKKNLERELYPMLEREFDIELHRQKIEIGYLETKVQRLKDILHKREQMKDRFLERHIRHVLENPPEFLNELEDNDTAEIEGDSQMADDEVQSAS